MSAEPRQTTHGDAWAKWQDQLVQGRFVLRRCLGWSEHSAVFLTEHKAKNLAEAAIKIVRTDAPQTKPLLAQWQAAVNLSHAHLVQLFEVGRWQFEGQDCLFVVMEYADQTLAEILRRRVLTGEELQELLPPVLEALTFLHRRQVVHGQLKPSNFMAVGDQLKLASDTIRPAGQDHCTADDVWSLGATLVEAITARARISRDQRFDVASLPVGLPVTLVETVQRCLSPSLADRPSIIELRAENKLASPPPIPVAKPDIQKVSQVAAPQPVPSTSRGGTPPNPAPDISREVAQPQAARTDSRVAALSQSTPIAPREAHPLPPVQTASRVSGSLHSVPSTSQETVQTASQVAVQVPAQAPVQAQAPRVGVLVQAAQVQAPVQVEAVPSRVAVPSRMGVQVQAVQVQAGVAVQAAQARPAAAPPEGAPKRHFSGIAAGALLLIGAVWIGLRSVGNSPAPAQQAAMPAPVAPTAEEADIVTPEPPASTPVSPPEAQSAAPPTSIPDLIHQVTPTVPEKIQSKIQGRVYVAVRVLVDPAGNVMGVQMEDAGPSKYFARISDQAAREWQFVPAETDATRVWRLRFEYTNSSVDVRTFEQ